MNPVGPSGKLGQSHPVLDHPQSCITYKCAYFASVASLTIYLEEEALHHVEEAARREGSSVSGWARKHLAEASRSDNKWPENYFETIAGFGGTGIEEPGEIPIPLDHPLLEHTCAGAGS